MTLIHLKYRPDIDGLRAFAVLSVIVYHAFPEILTGGFVGVDVFFVISGYLITGIISRNIQNNKFSFIEFYERRIRRIFPALIAVLLFTIFIGWHTQHTKEYKQLGEHVFGAAGFFSNFILYCESGYFDNAAETKPLLHLWSLSIEEQFYLFFPIILLLCTSRLIRQIKVVALILFASYSLNLYLTYSNSIAAFYMPFGRFWELMSGSLLALYQLKGAERLDRKFKDLQCMVGFLLLFSSILLINKNMAFPGWVVLFPVVGAVLVIDAGPNSILNKKVFSYRPLVLIGLISYPLYLWHWSLLVLPRVFEGQLNLSTKIYALCLTFALSVMTYKWIEKPFRFGSHGGLKASFLLVFLMVVGFFGLNTYQRDGLPFRTFVKINSVPSGFAGGVGAYIDNQCGLADPSYNDKFRHCISDTRSKPIYALYGDSKAGSLHTGLFRTSLENARWMFIGGNGPNGAPNSVLTDDEMKKPSQGHSSLAIEAISRNIEITTVVVATATRGLFQREGFRFRYDPISFEKSLHGMTNLVSRLVASGKRVVLLVDNPTFPEPQDCVVRKSDLQFINELFPERSNLLPQCTLSLTEHIEITRDYRNLLEQVKEKFPGYVYIFDSTPYLCNRDGDICPLELDQHSLYDDGDHISDYASGLVGRGLNEFIRNIQ